MCSLDPEQALLSLLLMVLDLDEFYHEIEESESVSRDTETKRELLAASKIAVQLLNKVFGLGVGGNACKSLKARLQLQPWNTMNRSVVIPALDQEIIHSGNSPMPFEL